MKKYNLEFCFKGSRTYVHGTDIFNKVIGVLKEAIKNIFDFNPNAKIIVMLRNPIDMVYSLHSQKIYSKDEDELDFKKAWQLSFVREQGKYIPKLCREVKTILYHKVASYFEQIENVYKYFPKEQVKIILFDDFKKNNVNTYKEVLNFLDVEYDGKINFEKINENKAEKNSSFGTFLARPPQFVRFIAKIIRSLLNINTTKIRTKLRNINTYTKKRENLNNELKEEIYNNYYEDIKKLSVLLDIDLVSKWKPINE